MKIPILPAILGSIIGGLITRHPIDGVIGFILVMTFLYLLRWWLFPEERL